MNNLTTKFSILGCPHNKKVLNVKGFVKIIFMFKKCQPLSTITIYMYL